MYKFWLGLLLISMISGNALLANEIDDVDGAKLYKKCAACHGFRGEKYALGKSAAINGMTKQQIITSIEDYQKGPDVGGMRALMKGEVKHLNKKQIEMLARYVVSLKYAHLSTLPVQIQPLVTPEKYVPDSFKIKMKTLRYAKDVTQVKVLIAHDSLTKREAKRKVVQQYYLTNIVFKEENRSVLEIKSTPYLSKNVVLKFKYKSYGGEKLHLQVYNNVGGSGSKSVVLKDDVRTKKPFVLTNNERMEEINSINDKAMYDYFGDIDLLPSNEIQLTAPLIASNSVSVPIVVRSTIKAKRVTLFASEESDIPKMIVELVLHQQTLVDFSVRIKLLSYMSTAGNLISVVVEGVDGKFYVTNIKVSVAIGGGGV